MNCLASRFTDRALKKRFNRSKEIKMKNLKNINMVNYNEK